MVSFSYPKSLPADKVQFIQDFYATSDEPTSVDKYLNYLTPDVDFIMGTAVIKGEAAVRKLRETMWGGVKTRHHQPTSVYSLSDASDDLMVHGLLDYGLRNGTVVKVEWAARILFAEGEGLKMKKYQVYIDGSPLKEALAKQAASE